jgi:hypothetical protein
MLMLVSTQTAITEKNGVQRDWGRKCCAKTRERVEMTEVSCRREERLSEEKVDVKAEGVDNEKERKGNAPS